MLPHHLLINSYKIYYESQEAKFQNVFLQFLEYEITTTFCFNAKIYVCYEFQASNNIFAGSKQQVCGSMNLDRHNQSVAALLLGCYIITRRHKPTGWPHLL